MPDRSDVAALQATLAEHLRAEARYRTNGTRAPLEKVADEVLRLPLDHGPLVDLTASETSPGAGVDTFDLGPGWLLIGRYDPRTVSIGELIRAIIETNLEDELADVDDDEDQEPDDYDEDDQL